MNQLRKNEYSFFLVVDAFSIDMLCKWDKYLIVFRKSLAIA